MHPSVRIVCDVNKKSNWSELQNCGARDLFSYNKSITSFFNRCSQCQPRHIHFLFSQKIPKASPLLSVIQLKCNQTTIDSDCVVPATRDCSPCEQSSISVRTLSTEADTVFIMKGQLEQGKQAVFPYFFQLAPPLPVVKVGKSQWLSPEGAKFSIDSAATKPWGVSE